MKWVTSKILKTIVIRCEVGEDLLTALTSFVEKENITSASLQVLGALKRARLGIFENGKYEYIDHEGALEIASGVGNVSVKEGKPFVHCHLMLSDHKGTVFGGHLMEGCIVNPTAEIHLQVLEGEVKRRLDKQTGLWILDI
jgi:hypothetical protein